MWCSKWHNSVLICFFVILPSTCYGVWLCYLGTIISFRRLVVTFISVDDLDDKTYSIRKR